MIARGSSREEIIKRLADSKPWPKVEGTPRSQRTRGREADRAALIESFTTKATAAGAAVRRASGNNAAAKEVTSVMKEGSYRSAVISHEEIIGAAGIGDILIDAGIRVTPLQKDTSAHREACFTADVGITGAYAGIAETGSLVLIFDRNNPRLISHAPFCHIAMLFVKDIIPDTETLFLRLSERGISPSAMALVTGPSMTADIALTPIRGIHGPGEVVIILID